MRAATSTKPKTPGSSPSGDSTSSSTTGAPTAACAGGTTLDKLQKPYRLMWGELQKLDRDIVFNLCQYGMGDVWKWGGEVAATAGAPPATWAGRRLSACPASTPSVS